MRYKENIGKKIRDDALNKILEALYKSEFVATFLSDDIVVDD